MSDKTQTQPARLRMSFDIRVERLSKGGKPKGGTRWSGVTEADMAEVLAAAAQLDKAAKALSGAVEKATSEVASQVAEAAEA